VLLDHLREEVRTLGEDSESAELILATLEEERATKRDELLAALDSARYTTLLDSFAESIASLPALDAPGGLRPIAADTLRKLRKAADALEADPPDGQLHALRIRAKRARYAAELAGGKKLEPYVEALKRVQDVIGEHQDAVVAEQRLRNAAQPKTAVAAGRLIERERERRLARRRDYRAAVDTALRRGRKALG
jgi:CHAD domain-containing protein